VASSTPGDIRKAGARAETLPILLCGGFSWSLRKAVVVSCTEIRLQAPCMPTS